MTTASFDGVSSFARPYRIDELVEVPELGTMYSLTIAPVRDRAGDVIVALVAGQRAYGDDSLSRILEVAPLGESGETYAFDSDGVMLTESRFTDEIRQVGLVAPVDDPSRAWDRSAQLNVQVRDPGGSLRDGFEPSRPLLERPLTRLVAQAAEGDQASGLLLTPYRNYRGIEVLAYGTAVKTVG